MREPSREHRLVGELRREGAERRGLGRELVGRVARRPHVVEHRGVEPVEPLASVVIEAVERVHVPAAVGRRARDPASERGTRELRGDEDRVVVGVTALVRGDVDVAGMLGDDVPERAGEIRDHVGEPLVGEPEPHVRLDARVETRVRDARFGDTRLTERGVGRVGRDTVGREDDRAAVRGKDAARAEHLVVGMRGDDDRGRRAS